MKPVGLELQFLITKVAAVLPLVLLGLVPRRRAGHGRF
jgi:hypothetical protein